MAKKIRLGISTCPNDTFAFHAILHKKIDLEGLEFRIDLLDVQELNTALLAGHYDVCKASFHAALYCREETVVLPSGAALGFGVGPVLLSHQPDRSPERYAELALKPIVLCPGSLTTATMLYRLYHSAGEPEQVVFSEIMPRLQTRTADFGVCIHEGRFSYQDYGLHLIEDLGETWESSTGSPLPLGGILARRSLGESLSRTIQSIIRGSIEYAQAHRTETVATMKQYAQELDDDVLFSHVDLYVNPWTLDMGEVGQQALRKLTQVAKARGIIEHDGGEIEVLSTS